MKRREFLVGTGGVLAGAALAAGAEAQQADAAWPVGDFVLQRRGKVLAVVHADEPGRVLWETDPEGNFLVAERATFRNRVTGIPEGSFEITRRGRGALGVADDRGGDARGGRA